MNNELANEKIKKLEAEKKEIEEKILKEKVTLFESEEFQTKKRAEQKIIVEKQLAEKYPNLLNLAWIRIPKFLNSAFSIIKDLSDEYSDFKTQEMGLIAEVDALKKEYVKLGGGQLIAKLCKEVGEPIEVCAGFKELLDALSVNSRSGVWTQRPGVVLNFFDQSRRNPRKDF